MKFSFWKPTALLLVGALLSACAATDTQNITQTPQGALPGASTPPTPVIMSMSKKEQEILQCIGNGGLKGKIIAVSPFVDNTKSKSGIGRVHLPGTASSELVVEALLAAGVVPLDRYNLDGHINTIKMTGDKGKKRVYKAAMAYFPDYVLNPIYLSSGVTGGPDVNKRLAGLGVIYKIRFLAIQATTSIQATGSGVVYGQGPMRQVVGFQESGLTFGRNFDGLLSTGKATVSDQQLLQEASLGMLVRMSTARSLITVMPNKAARNRCNAKLMALVGPQAASS